MSTEHSPEPWHVEERAATIGVYSTRRGRRGFDVGSVSYINKYRATSEPDARRIVACVNACVGITNEELETGRVVLDAHEGAERKADVRASA